MGFFMKKQMIYREILPTLYWASLVHLLIAVAGSPMSQMGDLNMFKLWANKAFDVGIHQAFVDPEFRYDWLPLYLYMSKAIGAVYDWSGLRDAFGPWSRGLSVLLKSTMVGFHIVTAYLLYAVCRVIGEDRTRANLCVQLYVWHPGLLIATSLYGYQDAFHTALVVGALLFLLLDKRRLTYVLCALVALTKPQAVIYLAPFVLFGLRHYGFRWILDAIPWVIGVCVLVLSPFLIYGTFFSVFDMYSGITNVHEWLTGCAHNIWWLVSPVPPFESDRLPLLFGFSGLQWGLFMFAVLTCFLCWRLFRQASHAVLLETCALLGFGFFMVVTEIHENHHYSLFAFLAPIAALRLSMRWVYSVLSITFAVGLMTTKWWLETDDFFQLGFLRAETLNAMVNLIVFVVWLVTFYIGWGKLHELDKETESEMTG